MENKVLDKTILVNNQSVSTVDLAKQIDSDVVSAILFILLVTIYVSYKLLATYLPYEYFRLREKGKTKWRGITHFYQEL